MLVLNLICAFWWIFGAAPHMECQPRQLLLFYDLLLQIWSSTLRQIRVSKTAFIPQPATELLAVMAIKIHKELYLTTLVILVMRDGRVYMRYKYKACGCCLVLHTWVGRRYDSWWPHSTPHMSASPPLPHRRLAPKPNRLFLCSHWSNTRRPGAATDSYRARRPWTLSLSLIHI